MTSGLQLISEHFDWISLGLGAATLILAITLAALILRRQRTLRVVLDDVERRSRVLSRIEVEIQELRALQEEQPAKPQSNSQEPSFRRPPDSGLEKKHRVVSLAQKGLNSEDIARQLNIYRGEAELVLSLSKYFSQNSEKGQDGLVQ